MEMTLRETERWFRNEGYSRREAEELAAALKIKSEEKNMSKTLLETRREQLAKLEGAYDKLKWMENRSGQQEDLYWQMHTGIPEIRKEIAQMEGKEDGRPLTLENKRFGDQDNRTTDIDRGYALRGPQDKKDYRSLYGPGDGYQWP